MSAIQKYPVLVLRLGGKNVGVPIINRLMATLEDLDEMSEAVWADIAILKDAVLKDAMLKDQTVAIATNYVPSQTAGTITVSPPSIPKLTSKDIGRTVVFGGGTAIGIVTGINDAFATVKLLQT